MAIRTALIGYGIGGRFFHEPLIGSDPCSWVSPQTAPRLRLSGPEATFVVPESDVQETKLKAGQRPDGSRFGAVPRESWGHLIKVDGLTETVPTLDGDYAALYRSLAGHLQHRAPVPVDPRGALRILGLIEAVLAAPHDLVPERS